MTMVQELAIQAIDGAIKFFEGHPERWCRDHYGLLKNGYPTKEVTLPDIASCCMVGALYRAADYSGVPPQIRLIRDTFIEVHGGTVQVMSGFNDTVAKNVDDIIKVLQVVRGRIVASS